MSSERLARTVISKHLTSQFLLPRTLRLRVFVLVAHVDVVIILKRLQKEHRMSQRLALNSHRERIHYGVPLLYHGCVLVVVLGKLRGIID